jgi:hypothetical protein
VQDAGEHLDRRRLAGAVRADVGQPLAPLHGEGDVAHGLDAAAVAAAAGGEFLGELGGRDGKHAVRSNKKPRWLSGAAAVQR